MPDHISAFDYIPVDLQTQMTDGTDTPDVTSYLQSALADAITMKKALYVAGVQSEYLLTSPLIVTGQVTIYGDGSGASRFITLNCNFILIGSGVNFVTLRDFTIASAVRYTDQPHEYDGITIEGTPESPCYFHDFLNVFVDGYRWAIISSNICSSNFGIRSTYTFGGIKTVGQSANNTVLGISRFSCGADSQGVIPSGSTGFLVGDGTIPQPEGFNIQPGTVFFGFDIGASIQGAINISLSKGVLLDNILSYGIMEQDGDAPSINNSYSCYIGMSANDSGSLAVYSSKINMNYLAQDRGTLFEDLEIAIYAGAEIDYGIYITGAAQNNVTIRGTREIKGTINTRSCKIDGGSGHVLTENRWDSVKGFETSVPCLYRDNMGLLAVGEENCFYLDGNIRVGFANVAPASGTYSLGDRTVNLSPSVNSKKMVLREWLCTASGSPGTHVPQYTSSVSPAI